MAVVQRLSKVARECNVGISTIVEFLHKKGIEMDMNPNTKVSEDIFELLKKEFKQDQNVKKASEELIDRRLKEKKESISIDSVQKTDEEEAEDESVSIDEIVGRTKKSAELKFVGKIDLDKPKTKEPERKIEEKAAEKEPAKEEPKAAPVEVKKEEVKPVAKTPEHIELKVDKPAEAPKVVGKIDLEAQKKKSITKPAEKVSQKPVEKKKEEPVKEKEESKPIETTVTEKISKPADQKPADVVTPPNEKKGVDSKENKENFMPTQVKKLSGPTVVGKIDLPVDNRTGGERDERNKARRKKRKRIKKEKERVNIESGSGGGEKGSGTAQPGRQPQAARPGDKRPAHTQPGQGQGQAQTQVGAKKKVARVKKRPVRPEVSEEDVAKQIKDTLARLTTKTKSKAARHRRDKRDVASQRYQAELERIDEEKKIIKVTEFVTRRLARRCMRSARTSATRSQQ